MNRILQPIKDFFGTFTKKIKTSSTKSYSHGHGYFSRLFQRTPRVKPEKLWCFYWDPYRQGLAATGLTGIVTLTIIATVLLVIGLITAVVLLFATLIYALAVAIGIGGLVLGGSVGSRASDDKSMGGLIVGAALGGWLGYSIAIPIVDFGHGIWYSGMEFAENLNLFFTVTNFISTNFLYILGIIFFPAFLVFTIATLTIILVYLLRGFEFGVLKIYGIRNPCPVCAEKTEPAVYSCKVCGTEHPHPLIPSQYGIFKQRCINGHELPTMLILGRNRDIPHRCPNPVCKTDLSSGAVGMDKHIAFVGGQTAGKTCLLVQVTQQLMKGGAEIPEPDQERDFLALKNRMEKGQVPDKTSPKNVYRAFQLLYRKGTFPYHIYFYDLAGEKFEHAQDAATHRFFGLLDTIIFAFDPYSIPEFRKNQSLPANLGIARQEPLDVIRNLSQVLERYNDKARLKKISLNVLMVKSDMGYLDKIIPTYTEQKQMNVGVRSFLMNELEQAAFLHHIEQTFGKINYYKVSALGRVPSEEDQSPFIADMLNESFVKIWKSLKMKIT